MALTGSLQFSPLLGVCKNRERAKHFKYVSGRDNLDLLATSLSSRSSRQYSWCSRLSTGINRPICNLPRRCNVLKCHSFLFFGHNITVPTVKTATVALTRSCSSLQSSPLVTKLVPAVSIIIFAIWGLAPLMQMSRKIFLRKTDSSWKKSTTKFVMTSYLQPMLLWTGATLICRALDPIVMPTQASQLVKRRLVNFVQSLSTVLAFAYCLSSVIQQAQKYFMETNDPSDTRNMGFQFAGKAVYSAVWVAAVSLFMELLGFSTQKWLTAGGLGTVLLTLAGREIFTNFLSSAMIHATRPFVVNEWIQAKIEGYEVSGTVEHVGWWSPTIIRGEDREAVHIPNHKFTVNVVRNLSQKTHWRIKTHLAISHLDVSKINNIVADMRKVLAKNPQVEQQKLHRRVFLENVNPENQALLILISCFVKTSHHEEYLCVKEAILLDLLRVISHHGARLATPIRTIQKFYSDADLENMPFSESIFNRGGPASRRPMLLIEPPYKINGEDKSKSQARTVRPTGEQDSRGKVQPAADRKTDGKPVPEPSMKETSKPGKRTNSKVAETSDSELREENKAAVASQPDPEGDDEATVKPMTVTTKVMKNSENDQSKGSIDHAGPEKSISSSVGSQSKHVDKLSASEASKSAPAALEENIVLGVALEGSKRTLPIEEEIDSPSTASETKEMAKHSSGNGSPAVDKDEKNK